MTLDAARAVLLAPGAVTDGFAGVGGDVEADELLVVFRWRADPKTYRVRFPLPEVPAASPWTGTEVGSAHVWAADVSGWLMEELDAGLTRRARRRRVGAFTDLGGHPGRGWDIPGYYISGVVLSPGGERGEFLAEAGFDVSRPRRLLAEGRLLTWLDAYFDRSRGPFTPVGHVAVSWAPDRPRIAVLEVLQVAAGAPGTVPRMLAHHAVHTTAEAGATEVRTVLPDRLLLDVGFRDDPTGVGQFLDTTRVD